MASPVDSARVATNIATAATSHAINVGSPVAGTLLVVVMRFTGAPGTVTFTGYTQILADTSDASDDDTRVFYRQADGSEGATDTLTTTNSVRVAAIAYEITGAADPSTQAPEVSGVNVGLSGSNVANAPFIAPTGGSKDYLFITVGAVDGEGVTFSALSGYANAENANTGTAGAGAGNTCIGAMSKQATASSEDAGAFTHAGGQTAWSAFTIAVHPPTLVTESYAEEVTADSPVAWYRMKETSGQLQDSSGNANHTTDIDGTPTYAQSSPITGEPSDTSIKLSGTERFTAPDHSTLDVGDTFTLEAWVKRNSADETDRLEVVFTKRTGGYKLTLNFFHATGCAINLEKSQEGSIVGSTVLITDTNWHHVVATKSGATSKLYLDGADVTGTVTNRTCVNNTNPLEIGAEFDTFQMLTAQVDEIALYATALSAERVAIHYAARSVGGAQSIPVSGLGSAQAFGSITPKFIVAGGGVGSAQAFGTVTTLKGPVNRSVSGLGSAQSFGSITTLKGPVSQSVGGVSSAQAFGTPTLQAGGGPQNVSVGGVASAQSFGTATPKATFTRTVTGLGSAQSFGAVTTTSAITRSVNGLASAQSFGTATTIKGPVSRSVTGIASAQAFGTPSTTAFQFRSVSGVPSAQAFSVTTKFNQTIRVNGIQFVPTYHLSGQYLAGQALVGWQPGQGPPFGVVTIWMRITVGSVSSVQAFGTVSPRHVARPLGVGSAQQFGTPILRVGGSTIPVLGIGSAQSFGDPYVLISYLKPSPPLSLILVPTDEEILVLTATGPQSLVLTPSAPQSATLTPTDEESLLLVPTEES